ncbi:DPY30 domain-containing protein 1-like [Athalia rosae]|uniref:DPY30 domain-containing protein 1-like n=1 Tax=Athalia rosae TaxID=37344 RepID=UPI0020345497|nr:DPY30 domain-containing protein 1-like [Athalia rosae]
MGEPLRNYLVKYVFPTLTQGLIKVAELRPDDPVDYLAEYLFKENPEGKMFEPDYTETMSMLLAAIEELQKDILPADEVDEDTRKYLRRNNGENEAIERVASAEESLLIGSSYCRMDRKSESLKFDDAASTGEKLSEEESSSGYEMHQE